MPTPRPVTNPLTDVMEHAEELIREQEIEMMAQFGIPLYVTERGKRAKMTLGFPDSPDGVSPEQLQELINIHGEDNVTQWMVDSLRDAAEDESATG